jgi:outer membrane protein assembly factor BamB
VNRAPLAGLIVAVFVAGWTSLIHADDWPQWRGPHGNGVSTEKGLPSRWSKDGVAWKAPLGGLGVSSPVVWGERIFVTSQVGRGVRRPGTHPTLARGEEASAEKPLGGARAAGDEGAPRGVEFLVEAFHRKDGRRLWQYGFASEGDLPAIHDKHNLASPSPVTDGRHVYAWFGTGQLVALDMDGRLAWQRNIAKEYSPFEVDWGHGSSPALYGELLYLLCDHKPASYLLALDKGTGKEKWKVDRGKDRKSHTTPTLVRGPRGDELIINSSERIDAYDPRTGELLWHTGEANRFPIPVPAFEGGVLYASRGYRSGPYMAIRTGGRGDVTRSHVQWSVATGAPYVSSLVYYDGLVYMANDAGIVTCVDAKSGEKVWQERIAGIFTASPVAGDGKVYLLSETGEVIVLAAGRQPRVLERNVMDERMVASPAVSRGQIFIRTDGHLIAIGRVR